MKNKTPDQIRFIMRRYDHSNPEAFLSTSIIARMCQMSVPETRKELKIMEEHGLVRSKKAGGLMWSAVDNG